MSSPFCFLQSVLGGGIGAVESIESIGAIVAIDSIKDIDFLVSLDYIASIVSIGPLLSTMEKACPIECDAQR